QVRAPQAVRARLQGTRYNWHGPCITACRSRRRVRKHSVMPQSISRRRLLHLIGVAAGSTAAYQAALGLGVMTEVKAAPRPDLAPPGAGKKVAILGAGIAGLTAAY